MDAALIAACSLLGLVCGSFANVVIHRVPAGEPILWWRVHRTCTTPMPPTVDRPMASRLVLRGRCRACEVSISGKYPMVAIASVVLFAAVGARIGANWALPGYLLFAWTLLVVAAIDVQTRLIPNRLTYALVPTLLALLAFAAIANGDPRAALRSVLGGLIGYVVFLAIAVPGGMGMGDAKLAGFVGIGLGHLGWGHLVLGLYGSFALGGVIALAGLATGRRKPKDRTPFAPYLATSSMATLLFGGELIDAYLRLSGLG